MKIVKASCIVIFITGLLAGVFFSSSVSAQDISGAWHGKLSLPTGSLTIEEFYKLKYCSTVVYMVPRA